MDNTYNRKCPSCGKEIYYGVNGCQLMDECFVCHGGSPKYTRSHSKITISWDDLDILENKCLYKE